MQWVLIGTTRIELELSWTSFHTHSVCSFPQFCGIARTSLCWRAWNGCSSAEPEFPPKRSSSPGTESWEAKPTRACTILRLFYECMYEHTRDATGYDCMYEHYMRTLTTTHKLQAMSNNSPTIRAPNKTWLPIWKIKSSAVLNFQFRFPPIIFQAANNG